MGLYTAWNLFDCKILYCLESNMLLVFHFIDRDRCLELLGLPRAPWSNYLFIPFSSLHVS